MNKLRNHHLGNEILEELKEVAPAQSQIVDGLDMSKYAQMNQMGKQQNNKYNFQSSKDKDKKVDCARAALV